ncbi:MAG: hypothetical protein BJ554DRAFT_1914 [Olpidium bornovanus]|uniref:Uncharacterized protein n=1 Tax=Olpidium bornovanus TaxID=278681 RepID=A0A8H8DH22_9FUNG|nr:MAG: hypothetical protein BJ554DRAFT_1914 [Olpidium bornovanus]
MYIDEQAQVAPSPPPIPPPRSGGYGYAPEAHSSGGGPSRSPLLSRHGSRPPSPPFPGGGHSGTDFSVIVEGLKFLYKIARPELDRRTASWDSRVCLWQNRPLGIRSSCWKQLTTSNRNLRGDSRLLLRRVVAF